MPRLLVALHLCTLHLCVGMLGAAESAEPAHDAARRFTTIHTVLRVADDIDAYLEFADDDEYRLFAEAEAAHLVQSMTTDQLRSLIDTPTSTPTWLDSFNAATLPDLATIPPLSTDAAYAQHVNGLIQRDLLQGTSSRRLRAELARVASPLHIPSLADDTILIPTEQLAGQTTIEVPMIAAVPRGPVSSAETAGIWLLVGLMAAPFAWLGWTEYRDLTARSRLRVESQVEYVNTRQASTSSREATPEPLGDEAPSPEQGEEPATELQELAATDEADLDLELGVLEDANQLLAAANGIRQEAARSRTSDTASPQSPEEIAPESTAAETRFDTEDLTSLRGVGSATRDYLASKGICTLNDLLEADVAGLQAILAEEGGRFQAAQPEKWVQQARELTKIPT